MSLHNYQRKTKPANWTTVAGAKPTRGSVKLPRTKERRRIETPDEKRKREMNWLARGLRKVKPSVAARRKKARVERDEYRKKARAFIEAAAVNGRCPVFAAFGSLPEKAQKFLTFCRAGSLKPGNVSEVHHSRGRLNALLLDERFFVALSKWGHRAVHAFPDTARRFGWTCAAGSWNAEVGPGAVVSRNEWGGVVVETLANKGGNGAEK